MSLAQISMRFWMAAMPAISVIAPIIAALLAVMGCVLRWNEVSSLFRRFVLRRSRYDYRKIFQEYLERFNAITDRRELYPALLAAACRILSASGASLVIRDSSDRFQMKASCGLRPFGFDLASFASFLEWLESYRKIVTRKEFVSDKAVRAAKNDGLRYCVQFNAEACVPLFVSDRLYGVINLGERKKGGYDAETKDLLRLLAVQFATAIHNANLYQALIRQNRELQEAAHLKTQLLANLSHELRTPLTSIMGLAELMADGADGPLSEEQRGHLTLIRKGGERLLATVVSMMDLSRIEANKLELDVQKVNLRRLVSKIAEEIRLKRGLALENNLEDGTPGVFGDEKRLGQVIRHLLDNAVKFTDSGKISIGAKKCGEMLQVSIKDTGIGIPPEKQRAIFDGFVQADGGVTRSHEGLGLGLTISRKLVELHGGRMWLTSKVGAGSEFNFTLPLKPVGVFNALRTPD
ncbi:MAG: HAMP domain-containing histidine kinase [Proteobacteria bacterium]|nr:HAMP domain-containing histidine kinase [Pseudomonadota bacterium]